MHSKQIVADMANEVLARQAAARARWSGEPFGEALDAILRTEAGRQLRELGDGPYRNERAQQWQEDLARERAEARIAALSWPSSDEASSSPWRSPR